MSTVLDEGTRRRAKVRAAAAAVVDAPRRVQRFTGAPVSPRPHVDRKRFHGRGPEPPTRRRWFPVRGNIAMAALLVQLGMLGTALFAPQFRVTDVSIDGAQLLTTSTVLDAAGVSGTSIFAMDGDAVRSHLLANPWIRTASVTAQLPHSVHIVITEWSPVLRLVHQDQDMLMADSGAMVATSKGRPEKVAVIPVLVDLRTGAASPDAHLVQLLDATTTNFPTVFGGVKVAAFEWQADGRFDLWTSAGWRASLGHVDTQDQINAIPRKLAALGAIRGALNLTKPAFGYVDLQNPDAPAVGGTPGLPKEVTAAIALPVAVSPAPTPAPAASTAAPGPSASSAPPPAAAATVGPSPKPAPTPAPTPTPYTFYLPPASSPGQH